MTKATKLTKYDVKLLGEAITEYQSVISDLYDPDDMVANNKWLKLQKLLTMLNNATITLTPNKPTK